MQSLYCKISFISARPITIFYVSAQQSGKTPLMSLKYALTNEQWI